MHFRMWRDRTIEGYDCGDEVSNWLCRHLSVPNGRYRLLYHRTNLANSRLIRNDEKYHFIVDKSRDDKVTTSSPKVFVIVFFFTILL